MNTNRNFKMIALLLAVIVLLAGGIGITGAAAQSAINRVTSTRRPVASAIEIAG